MGNHFSPLLPLKKEREGENSRGTLKKKAREKKDRQRLPEMEVAGAALPLPENQLPGDFRTVVFTVIFRPFLKTSRVSSESGARLKMQPCSS